MKRQGQRLFRSCLMSVLFLFLLFFQSAVARDIPRISVQDAHWKVTQGKALLVCSYADQYCHSILLKGAMLQSDFESKSKTLPKNSEIVFYCA